MSVTKKKALHFIKKDFEGIIQFLDFYYYNPPLDSPCLEDLMVVQKKMVCASVVEPKDIPMKIATLNSHVTLMDVETSAYLHFHLSLPGTANTSGKKVSIFSALGCAVLGCSQGDIVEFKNADDMRMFFITSVINELTNGPATQKLSIQNN